MVRRKFKWKFGVIFSILLLNVFTKSLPLDRSVTSVPVLVAETTFPNLVVPDNVESNNKVIGEIENANDQKSRASDTAVVNEEKNSTDNAYNVSRTLLRQQIRPGQNVEDYSVEITIDGSTFHGTAIIDLTVTTDTREDALIFHAEDMNINAVRLGTSSAINAQDIGFFHDEGEGFLEVYPEGRTSTSYIVIVEYSAPIRNDGTGIFAVDFNGHQYLGMNLYPTYARRVFPCVDELTENKPVIFNFVNVDFPMMTANSVLVEEPGEFAPLLSTPIHLWGMIAHNFQTVMIPVTDVILRGRTGLNQDAQAITAIQFYFNTLNEWTNKNYFEIIVDQNGQMNMFALPDTNVDWSALSTVCIWEPYIFMEQVHSVAQRKTSLVKIAEAMARQWFGFVIHPQNWRHEWAVTGLRTYAAYDIAREFQTDPIGLDTTMLDMETIFIVDVMHESLLRDGYANAIPLLQEEDIFDQVEIRDYINGLIKYKAPSILWFLKTVLGRENDYIQRASQALLNRRALNAVTSLDVISAIEDEWWVAENNKLINDLEEYLEPWITARGYPVLVVGLNQRGVSVSQEHFAFTAAQTAVFNVPITYTKSTDMNFENLEVVEMMENTINLPMSLDEDERDFVLFNIQGQGYYRVEYENELMERIIECLEEPDCRNQIHPLNRATLIDDSLNLARAGRIGYDFALRMVLTMEHETEYAPWKAFIRNMNFLRRRLVSFVSEDDDLDQDIYLRMVRRTIVAVEDQLTFYPDPLIVEPVMTSLTRGMVMDHACRAGYAPCIAAAIDWFYDPNSAEPQVNPDIPKDIRPAVYCTMVREGDADVINALYERLEIEPSHWERIVILESLACSQDDAFINSLLQETVDPNGSFGLEERSKIFAAVAESSYSNLYLAINFARLNTDEIRSMYGGAQRLEEMIYVLADNAGNDGTTSELAAWIDSVNSRLDDSVDIAQRYLAKAVENLVWDDAYRDVVYEWIDENDATTAVLSAVLLCMTVFITLFNH